MKKNKKFIFFTLFFLIGIWSSHTNINASPSSQEKEEKSLLMAPEENFISQLAKKAINCLTTKSITESERKNKFKALFKENFDVPALSKFVLGRYNRRATQKEKELYQKLFVEHISKIYSGYLSQYDEKAFEVLRNVPNKRGGIWVISQVVREKAPPVIIKWLVFKNEKNPQNITYKIYDVVVEGISLSVAQRSEYAAIIQKNGGTIQGLLNVMEEKLNTNKLQKNQ